jgi:hypothetical protein
MPYTDDDLAPGFRLDDDFVSAAPVKEGSARERSRQAKRERRREGRPRRPRRKHLVASDWVAPAIGIGVLVVGMWVLGLGPFEAKPSSDVTPRREAAGVAAGEGTTSTTIGIQRRRFERGDCVIWDQRPGGDGTTTAKVVGCDEPHLIEITGRYTITGRTENPSVAEWVDITQHGECRSLAVEYLGADLDPYGRFHPQSIGPSPEGWAQGDREVWCGISTRSPEAHSDPKMYVAFTGAVKGQPQAMVFNTGACLATDPATGGIMGTVPCGQPHVFEVTGTVDSAGYFAGAPVPNSGEWNRRLNTACTNVTRTYFSGKVPPGVFAIVMPIEPESWRTGQRTAHCLAARLDSAHKPIPQTVAFLPAQ